MLHLAETDLLGDTAANPRPLQRHVLVVCVHKLSLAFLLNHHDDLRREYVGYDKVLPRLLVDLLHVVNVVLLARNDELRKVSASSKELAEN